MTLHGHRVTWPKLAKPLLWEVTFALVSDGELQEGQLWEAGMFAAHNDLNNFVVLLDANDSQVDGPVSSITTIEPTAAKWESCR